MVLGPAESIKNPNLSLTCWDMKSGVCSGSGRLPQLSSSFRAELLDRVRIMCSKTPIGATLKGKLRRKFIFYSIKAHIFDENRQVLREIYKMSEFHFRNSAFVVQWGFYFLFAKHIVLLHAFASAIYNYLSSWRIWLPLHVKPMLTFSRNYYRIYPPTMWFRKLSPRNVQNPDHLVSKTQTKRNYISPKRLKPGSQLVRRQSKYSSWIFQYDLQYLKYFLNYVCILIEIIS